MAKFPFIIYAINSNEEGDVFSTGKSQILYSEDFKNGLSRVGGVGRAPSYCFSYLISARRLIDHAAGLGTYDEIGLPVLYLQRHCTELLLKRLLEWCHDLVDLRTGETNFTFTFSKDEADRLKRSHDLKKLYKDLDRAINALGYQMPGAISTLIKKIDLVEPVVTFARYERSFSKTGGQINHVSAESLIPIVEMQKLLEQAVEVSLYKVGVECLEMNLYEEWCMRST